MQEDPLEEDMATLSSILAGRIPWTEETCGLQSMGSQWVGRDWASEHFTWNPPFVSYLLLLPFLDKWDPEHPCQVKPGDLHCQALWVSVEPQTAGGQGHWLCWSLSLAWPWNLSVFDLTCYCLCVLKKKKLASLSPPFADEHHHHSRNDSQMLGQWDAMALADSSTKLFEWSRNAGSVRGRLWEGLPGKLPRQPHWAIKWQGDQVSIILPSLVMFVFEIEYASYLWVLFMIY